MTSLRRWYDRDETLQEALELLNLATEEEESSESEFVLRLQEQVASEVIDKLYENIKRYYGKGHRWYDNDPVMIKAMELLKEAPPNVQRVAATKLLKALAREDSSELQNELLNEEK
ncbi:MAG: hypothetical protein WCK67_06585 [bacterium]